MSATEPGAFTGAGLTPPEHTDSLEASSTRTQSLLEVHHAEAHESPLLQEPKKQDHKPQAIALHNVVMGVVITLIFIFFVCQFSERSIRRLRGEDAESLQMLKKKKMLKKEKVRRAEERTQEKSENVFQDVQLMGVVPNTPYTPVWDLSDKQLLSPVKQVQERPRHPSILVTRDEDEEKLVEEAEASLAGQENLTNVRQPARKSYIGERRAPPGWKPDAEADDVRGAFRVSGTPTLVPPLPVVSRGAQVVPPAIPQPDSCSKVYTRRQLPL